jgi:hypothetical protein
MMESKDMIIDAADDLHIRVRNQIHDYPYLAVAAGAGLGFLVAGGLRSAWTRRLLGAVGSVALLSPLWSRLIGAGFDLLEPVSQTKSPETRPGLREIASSTGQAARSVRP